LTRCFHSIEIATALGKPPPAHADDIIRFMKGWPLDSDPGTRYSHSNLGYCLLGRVIEQTTGRSYEAYLKNSVLKPLGITLMRTGKTLTPAPGEVTYLSARRTRWPRRHRPAARSKSAAPLRRVVFGKHEFPRRMDRSRARPRALRLRSRPF
jgi:CubicO group peptidase (beta-lactamase class C family)